MRSSAERLEDHDGPLRGPAFRGPWTNICFQDADSKVKTSFGSCDGRVKVDALQLAFNAKAVAVKLDNNMYECLEADTSCAEGWSIQRFQPGVTYLVFPSKGEGACLPSETRYSFHSVWRSVHGTVKFCLHLTTPTDAFYWHGCTGSSLAVLPQPVQDNGTSGEYLVSPPSCTKQSFSGWQALLLQLLGDLHSQRMHHQCFCASQGHF